MVWLMHMVHARAHGGDEQLLTTAANLLPPAWPRQVLLAAGAEAPVGLDGGREDGRALAGC